MEKNFNRFRKLKRRKIYPILKAFEQHMEKTWFVNCEWPLFDAEHLYFLVAKVDRENGWHSIVSDAWDNFLAGWEARDAIKPSKTISPFTLKAGK